jgi:hypothetical protein
VHLASDHIHPYKDAGGSLARCRVRIYLPDDMRDAPVVICSELPNNCGGSITNSVELIAAGVIQANELPTPLVWIEHWPEESTEEQETFELVVFSNYEVVERAPYLGVARAWIGEPTWKRLDHATVEVLVGGELLARGYREAPLLLWSYKVDYGLDTDSDYGDEDQSPGHRLVAGVQVATDGE